jgi:hypothetical protein
MINSRIQSTREEIKGHRYQVKQMQKVIAPSQSS